MTTPTKRQRQLSTLLGWLIATAVTLLAIVLLTSCANWETQQQLVNQLPPGQREYAQLQLERDKQQARMQVAAAVSTAAANLAQPGSPFNPYQVEVRHYNYPGYRYPYCNTYPYRY
jgi:hypothetical protein